MQKFTISLLVLLSTQAFGAKFFYKNNFLTYYTTHDFSQKSYAVKSLVIVVHGALRNGDEYFADTVAAAKKHGVSKEVMVVAPHFRRESDERLSGEIYYGNRWNTKWKYGYKSQDSDSVSSFTLIDSLISRLEESKNFPNLETVVVTGHSAGGQFTQRYSVGTQINSIVNAKVKFVPSNPSSYMFLGKNRYEFKRGNYQVAQKPTNCSEYNDYIYGPKNRASYLQKHSVKNLKTIFTSNKVIYLMSEEDKGTDSLDRSCEAMTQGSNRFERSKNFWHYVKKDLSSKNHRFLSIPRIGHEHVDVYESDEAGEVVFGLKAKKHTSYLYKKIGDSKDIETDSKKLYLLLGGGKNEEAGFRKFLKASNGGDILVISAKEELNQRYTHDLWNIAEESKIKIDSVETISFLNEKAGSKLFVINKIKNAEAIFFTGGNQAKYLNRIKGTKAHRAIVQKIKAGTPIAGTSAGLAIMGEYIFSAKKGGLSSSYVLKNPHAKEIIIENKFLGIDLLSGVITDTHFMNRSREGRLLAFMFRAQFDYELRELFGIGIDEQSSLVITEEGMLPVGGVHIYNKPLGLVPEEQHGKLGYGPLLKKSLVSNKKYPHLKEIRFRNTIRVISGEVR